MANYIKYGDLDVDQEAYLKKIADEADAYVESQPWSTKQKNRWRQAYSDIVSRGITGASVATEGQDAGRWQINYNGDSIDTSMMDDRDKRAYGDAAYFLKTQMESLSTPKEEVKEDLPVFDNKTFTTGLNQQMTSKLFGGHSWTTQEDWNPKDERDSTGKRGTKNRAELLAQQLELYRDSLEEGKYSFEGSPFENLEDFKNRINNAVAALRTPDPKDDLDALNKIGLKYRDFLYDGLDDTWGNYKGTPVSYAQYNKLQEAEKQASDTTTQPPVNPETVEESKPSYFQKQVDNIRQLRQNIEDYRQQGGGVSEKAIIGELTGIGLDIASIIDAEPFSAAGLALGAATARELGPGHTGWGNRLLDYGTALIGAIPLLGDAALTAKTLARFRPALQNLDKFLRYTGRGISLYDLAFISGEDALAAVKKVLSGESLNMNDWRALGNFVKDVAINGTLNRQNRAERTALKQQGIEISKGETALGQTKAAEYLRKRGWLRTKPADSELNKTEVIRLKKADGEEVQLKVDNTTKKNLEESFKGKTDKEKLDIVKNNDKIKKEAAAIGVNLEEIKGFNGSIIRSAKNVLPKKIREYTENNRGIFKTNTTLKNPVRNMDNYLAGRKQLKGFNNWWTSMKEGSVKQIQGMSDFRLGNQYGLIKGGVHTDVTNPNKAKSKYETPTQKISENKPTPVPPVIHKTPENREVAKLYRDLIINKNYSNNKLISNGTPTPIGKGVLQVVEQPDGTFTIIHNGDVIANERNQIEIQNRIRDIIKQSRLKAKEMGETLKQYKSYGWLKHGGKLDDNEKFLNIIKDVYI